MDIIINGYLNHYTPGYKNKFSIELDKPTHIFEILDQISVPREEVQLVVINGVITNIDEALITDNDNVIVNPLFIGG